MKPAGREKLPSHLWLAGWLAGGRVFNLNRTNTTSRAREGIDATCTYAYVKAADRQIGLIFPGEEFVVGARISQLTPPPLSSSLLSFSNAHKKNFQLKVYTDLLPPVMDSG